MNLFEVVYGKNPPSVLSYMLNVSKVQQVDQTVIVHMAILRTPKENLVMAQNHMKQQVENGRFECGFVEGEYVILWSFSYSQESGANGLPIRVSQSL
jgi:hypothetical protein